MEYWESLVNSYEDSDDFRCFSKALQAAESVLKEDLAVFEIDWFLQTLLSKPVSIIDVIQVKHRDDSWLKTIGDTYELLGTVVSKFTERIEPWLVRIVELCSLPLDARTRTHALHCVTACARIHAFGMYLETGQSRVAQYVAGLEEGTSCRAPMAVFIGTICEHHPESIAEEVTRIWRVYLNMLDSNKNTDTVINSVLLGINGLLKHFGSDLPTMELGRFYQKMSSEYIKIDRCVKVILSIITNYIDILKVFVCSSRSLRVTLWSCNDAVETVMVVYKMIAQEMSRDEIKKIIKTEVEPHTTNPKNSIKYTAYRIINYIDNIHNIHTDVPIDCDIYTLEYIVKDQISYEQAEAIAFCIECKMADYERILQSCLLYYDNLPTNKRKSIVVNGVFNSGQDMMVAYLTTLITESCLPSSLEKYLPIWKDLSQTDELLNRELLLQLFVKQFVSLLDVFIDGASEILPETLQNLLYLTSHIFTFHSVEYYTNDQAAIVLSKLVELTHLCGLEASIVAAMRSLIPHLNEGGSFKEIYDLISIEQCADECLLCESCLALVHAPDTAMSAPDNTLAAIQIILSRKDAESNTLICAVRKLESLITNNREIIDNNLINKIMKSINKIRNRKDLVGKEARVLQRDLTIFVGKYSNDFNNNIIESFDNSMRIEDLCLEIPNPIEGTKYKINLSRILDLALAHEDEQTLMMLLTIICAHNDIASASSQLALGAVLCGCARVSASLQTVVAAAVCVTGQALFTVLQHIVCESSPGVRRLLSDLIEGILMKETSDDGLVTTLAEKVVQLMNSDDFKSKQAGLDITESLISSLNEDNVLSKTVLPNLLTTVAKTNEIKSYTIIDKVSNLLMDKIELFNQDVLDDIVKTLLQQLLKSKNPIENCTALRIYNNKLKSIVKFVKALYEYKDKNPSEIAHRVFELREFDVDAVRCLTFVAELPLTFDVDCKEILDSYDGWLLDILFSITFENGIDEFRTVGVLRFLANFSDVMLKFHCQRTVQFINEIVKKLTPPTVKRLKRQLSSCLSKYKDLIDVSCLECWVETLPIRQVTESIEKNDFLKEHFMPIEALRIMLDIFDLKNPSLKLTHLNIYASKWAKILLKTYATGYVKHLKVEMSYLTDLLSVSLRFLTVTDVKRVLKEGHGLKGAENENVGIEFGRFFMSVFDTVLMSKPFILLSEDMSDCSVLINDLVKVCVRKRRGDSYCEILLELVDLLWPTYCQKSTYKQKYNLLLDLTFINKKLGSESNPYRWVVSRLSGEDASIVEKAELMEVLPGGECYSNAYIQVLSTLPARLCEVAGPPRRVWGGAVQALARTADTTLLGIVINLVAGASAPEGCSALEPCVATLASHPDCVRILDVIYSRVWEGVTTGVCAYILVPMLRHSSCSNVISFMSPKLPELLGRLRHNQKLPSTHYNYHKCVVDNTKALEILAVAFEKIPAADIESPTSPLYVTLETDKSWQLVRDVCKLCVTLRDRVKSPEGASVELLKCVRMFHCVAYNCMCACISMWKPDDKIYQTILDSKVWEKVIDCNEIIELPLRAHWNHRTVSRCVCVSVRDGGASTSARTRLYLRTLSENPMLFDFIEQEGSEEIETTILQVSDSPLNSHPCAVTLTALLTHLTSLGRSRWQQLVVNALNGGETNVRWMLAQAICNCKEELRSQASVLAPGLVAVVCDTPIREKGRTVLNDLHVDILNTLILWGPDSRLTANQKLNKSAEYLITTCLVNSHRQSIYKTLMDVITKMLDSFGNILKISWSVFEDYVKDTNSSKATITILLKITKNNIYIPQLIPQLTNILSKNYQGYQLSKLAELFGLAIKCYENRNSDVQSDISGDIRSDIPSTSGFRADKSDIRSDNSDIRSDKSDIRSDNTDVRTDIDVRSDIRVDNIDSYMIEFRKVLNRLKKTNVGDFIKLVHYSGCCDESQFRTILDLTQKLPQSERAKCIDILSTYIYKHPTSHVIHEMPHDLKELVVDFSQEALFEEFFKTRSEPAAKRIKMDSESMILDTFARNEGRFTNILLRMNKKQYERVADRLTDSNMAVRLTECFYIYIYIPLVYNNNKHVDFTVCMSSFYNALFTHLKTNDRFKQCKLRENPLNIPSESTFTKILTNCKSYAGSLRSNAVTSGIKRTRNTDKTSVIDVHISIENILDTFIQFAKSTPEVSIELLIQLVNTTSNGFDSRPMLARMLAKLIEANPILIELCRSVIDQLCAVDGIEDIIKTTYSSVFDSEVSEIMQLLYEEVAIKTGGEHLYVLGSNELLEYDISMNADEDFSIEALVCTFKKLSNWDVLTVRERSRVQSLGLPPLWEEGGRFTQLIEDYTDTTTWFGKMVELYKNNKRDSVQWVKEIDRYPRKHFEASAITEAVQWHDVDSSIEDIKLPSFINKNDCLAEWAGRLMVRSAYLTGLSEEETPQVVLSRSHELRWCERATEMALPQLALQCIKKRTVNLNDDEALPWLEQKVLALRAMGLAHNDSDMVREALDKAVKYSDMFYNQSSPDTILGINTLMMRLHHELNSLTPSKISEYYTEITTQYSRLDHKLSSSSKVIDNMQRTHECIMYYYEDNIKQENFQECLNQMLVTSQRAIDLNLKREGSFIAIILNKIKIGQVDDEMYKMLAKLVQSSLSKLPPYMSSHVRATMRGLFPSSGLAWESPEELKVSRCLQLVCDPPYTLMMYCTQLEKALVEKNESLWNSTFVRMKQLFFENEYIGPDYMPLLKHKKTFYSIEKYDTSSISIVRDLSRSLSSRPVTSRRVSALCPALAQLTIHGGRVDEQIQVYVDSVSRPCVVTSLGCARAPRRHLIKREGLHDAAAAECVINTVRELRGDCTITPLSVDCSMISYYEDHIRVRDLVTEQCDLDEVCVVRQSRRDDELVISPALSSLKHHRDMRSKIPPDTLRKAIENRCRSTQEFICKKRAFEESLACVTIVTWMFGLGDRHLNNLLYSLREGVIRTIDWGGVLQYGGGELPPARLTPNIVAVCNIQAFESKLQNKLSSIRSNQRLYLPIVKLMFGNSGNENVPYIESLIKGMTTSYNITKQILSKSNKLYKEKYIQLLDSVFEDFVEKDLYDVDEQVSILLRQSTDPRILSVVRTGWEPWI